MYQVGIVLTQRNIAKSWILLDTFSTHSVLNNLDMVSDIFKFSDKYTLTITMNADFRDLTETANLNIFTVGVHFDQKSVATNISLKDLANVPGRE